MLKWTDNTGKLVLALQLFLIPKNLLITAYQAVIRKQPTLPKRLLAIRPSKLDGNSK